MTTRCSRASEPWWAFTSSSPDRLRRDALVRGEFVEAGGEPLGLAAGVAEDDGAAVGEHLLQDARVDAGPDAAALPLQRAAGRAAAQLADDLPHGAHVLHRHDHLDLERLAHAGVDDGDRAATAVGLCPPRKWAISSSGRCVALSPMRCGGRFVSRSSRSRLSIRWAPRLVVAMAWISSMMIVSTLTSVLRTSLVSMRYRLSGVVMSRSTGRR